MKAESWETNWEMVKRIGEGGQGTIDLVRRRVINETTGSTAIQLRKVLQDLTSSVFPTTPPDHESTTKDFVELLRRLLNSNVGEFGALKRLRNPETARDPEHAQFRHQKEVEVLTQQIHPNLLRLLEIDDEQNWYVATYCDGGDLRKSPSGFHGNALGTLEALRPIIAAVAMLHETRPNSARLLVARVIPFAQVLCHIQKLGLSVVNEATSPVCRWLNGTTRKAGCDRARAMVAIWQCPKELITSRIHAVWILMR